jgi:PIN domain nuclease of toxin-antitoxin system
LLLDTHVFIWLVTDDPRLGAAAREVIGTADKVSVSIASLWEIQIKVDLGKLTAMPEGAATTARESNLEILPIAVETFHVLAGLTHHHKDLFDRMLIAQALHEHRAIVTSDRMFAAYQSDHPLRLVDATR